MSARSLQRMIGSVLKQPHENGEHFGDIILKEGIEAESVPSETCTPVQSRNQLHELGPNSSPILSQLTDSKPRLNEKDMPQSQVELKVNPNK